MNEQELTAYVDFYVDQIKAGKEIENSISSLRDFAPETMSLLLKHYRINDRSEVRHAIAVVIRDTFGLIKSKEQRENVVAAFGQDLLSDRQEYWKPALDILYAAEKGVAFPYLNLGLASALQRKEAQKEKWIREVIEDQN
jgi:hypothetical protein